MALNAAQQWWVRSDGAETNGGGFDSTVSGAGTNYSDQASPQLSLTDLTTVGASATVNTVLGTFTSAMVGNIMRIASGTSFTAGYYMIITFNSATQVVLDRVCSSGSGSIGVAKVGGAHLSLKSYANGGDLGSPAITSPIAPGHTINMRGAGTSDPTGTVQYDYSAGYWTFPAGDSTSGPIKVIGYNGRPFIGTSPLLIYNTDLWTFTNVSVKVLATIYASHGFSGDTTAHVSFVSSFLDGNGNDVVGVLTTGEVRNSRFKNTGAAGSTAVRAAVSIGNAKFGVTMIGCSVKGWRGPGVYIYRPGGHLVMNNVIESCGMDGIYDDGLTGQDIANNFIGNTVYGCRDGYRCNTAIGLTFATLINNIFANNSGYGINANFGSAAANDLLKSRTIDFNNFYSNTSGARNNLSAGANDTALDPQFTATGSDDFSVGTNMKAIGFPGAFPLAGSTGYTDLGAVQRQEAGGTTVLLAGRRRGGANLGR